MLVDVSQAQIFFGNALDHYEGWPTPTCIISDGAYGIGGFMGDPYRPEDLPQWYEPHVKVWSQVSTSETTLWFWNTEVGWASVHPLLVSNGWLYEQLIVWDKGLSHIAGNVNSNTIRSVPVVTEVCARYTRPQVVQLSGDTITLQSWLRSEWARTGLPKNRANEACGVSDAATRKYLTEDPQWYAPPPEVFEKLHHYANEHGDPAGRPYFALDRQPGAISNWVFKRAKWNHQHGLTNVWACQPVRGTERVKTGPHTTHPNQKPMALMELQVRLVTDPGDVVWEPFGGLCTATLAASKHGRKAYASEVVGETHQAARRRFGLPNQGAEISEDQESVLSLFKV